MRPLVVGVLQWVSLLLVGVSANPFPAHLTHRPDRNSLARRALQWDSTCDTNYDGVTARALLEASMDLAPKMAQAGSDALDKVSKIINAGLQNPQTDPGISQEETTRIKQLYKELFGTPKRSDSARHLTQIELIKMSLSNIARTSKSNPPDLIMHCDDSWLLQSAPEGQPPKPTEVLEAGKEWLFDTDRKEWQVWPGKPCVGQRSGVTTINHDGESRQER